jgi:NAD(P)-dependent dehydrogenase (short-subunit alcohol dehydrogenase family)
MEQLSGRIAVITGAASGIGRALADVLAAEGMKLALADVESGPLGLAVADLRAKGAEVLGVVTDVADAGSMDAFAQRTLDHYGAVHVVCNNAGVAGGGTMWDLTAEDWQFVLGPNLWGVVHGVRVFGRYLVAQNEGHIVNTASVAGLASFPGLGPYNVSKHAVVTLSETLNAELRFAKSEVGVSVLCPGFVNTRIFEPDRHRARAGDSRVAQDELGRQIAASVANTFMQPDVVAKQVLDAIRQRRFYVFTHPGTEDVIRRRMEGMLSNTPPEGLDPSVLAFLH